MTVACLRGNRLFTNCQQEKYRIHTKGNDVGTTSHRIASMLEEPEQVDSGSKHMDIITQNILKTIEAKPI